MIFLRIKEFIFEILVVFLFINFKERDNVFEGMSFIWCMFWDVYRSNLKKIVYFKLVFIGIYIGVEWF